MNTVHTETRHGLTINIYQDEGPDSPSARCDDALFLVGYHRDFWIKGPKEFTKEELIARMTGDVAEDTAAEYFNKYHVFALSAYIHSGVKLYLGGIVCTPFDTPSSAGGRGWDTSLLGAVLVAKKEWPDQKDAEKAAEGLVETWNDYLSGNVFNYEIRDQNGESLGACCSFYGDYEKNALIEARAEVDAMTKNGTQDANGQMLLTN